MFTAADWEGDVPQQTAAFPQVQQKKGSKSKKKVCMVLAPKKGNEVPMLNNIKQKRKRSLSNARSISNSADDKSSEPKRGKKNKMDVKNGVADNFLDRLDETIIANKKQKMMSANQQKIFGVTQPNEIESILFGNDTFDKKKMKQDKYKKILNTHLNRTIQRSGASLRQRMAERLKAAQFRYLNEKLYLSEGKDAKELFKNDPAAFKIYHNGFKQQMKKWPINPLEVIIKEIAKMPKETKVADMGCGEAELARRVPQRVRSFDLVAGAGTAGVEECDMAHTPLLAGEMDVAVYCLALMGTNLKEYLIEANRILRVGGTMKIAEVESRFKDVNEFIRSVESYGFKLGRADDSRKVFYFMDFKKQRDLGSKRGKLPLITLEPCLYKKR